MTRNYSIIDRLRWLPLLEAPSHRSARHVFGGAFLGAAFGGALLAATGQWLLTVPLTGAVAGWILGSWWFSLTYKPLAAEAESPQSVSAQRITEKLDPNELANILVGQAMELALFDDLWRLRGFGPGRPRRGRLSRRFLNADQSDREWSFLREIVCAAVAAQFSVIQAVVRNAVATAMLARILQLATAGPDGSGGVARSLGFDNERAALSWVADALVEYRRVDAPPKVVDVWRDRMLRNAPSIGTLEAEPSFERELNEGLQRAVSTIQLLVRAGVSKDKISVINDCYVEMAASVMVSRTK